MRNTPSLSDHNAALPPQVRGVHRAGGAGCGPVFDNGQVEMQAEPAAG